MGAYDVPLLIGAAAVVGYFILQNPDLLSGIFPSTAGGDDPAGEFTEGEQALSESDTTKTSGGSICGQLCRDKNCSAYKRECTTGCVHCCDSGPNSKSCGGGSSGGSGGGGGSICGQLCKAVNCTEYYKNNCSAGCSKCNLSTSSGGSGGGKSTSCKPCAKGYQRTSGCTCKAKSTSSQKTFNPNENKSCAKLCSGGLCGTYKSNKCSGSCKFCPKSGLAKAYYAGYTNPGRAHGLAYQVAQTNWARQGISVS